MADMIRVEGWGFAALLADHPVARAQYREFALATGTSLVRRSIERSAPDAPAVDVSQVNAEAYCKWRGARDGRAYRLPSMAELQALVDVMGAAEVDPAVWPHEEGHSAGLIGGLEAHYLCEWTCEQEQIERIDRTIVLGSIFYPPWLREGSNNANAQAHLQAGEGFSFVTFRVAVAA